MSPSAINAIVSALRFFFKVTLGRPTIRNVMSPLDRITLKKARKT
jgi:hypothetical protein